MKLIKNGVDMFFVGIGFLLLSSTLWADDSGTIQNNMNTSVYIQCPGVYGLPTGSNKYTLPAGQSVTFYITTPSVSHAHGVRDEYDDCVFWTDTLGQQTGNWASFSCDCGLIDCSGWSHDGDTGFVNFNEPGCGGIVLATSDEMDHEKVDRRKKWRK